MTVTNYPKIEARILNLKHFEQNSQAEFTIDSTPSFVHKSSVELKIKNLHIHKKVS